MRKRAFGKITALLTALIFVFLSIIPSTVITNAATLNVALTVAYNASARQYELTYPSAIEPAKTYVTWHNPDGTQYAATITNGVYSVNKETIVLGSLQPDHIYDISVSVYANATDQIGVTQPYAAGSTYYLSSVTFTGESFNVMAKMSDIEDNTPALSGGAAGSAVSAKSGNHPQIRLRWRIPTIYNTATSAISYIINDAHHEFLSSLSETGAAITTVGFQINMNKGKSSPQVLTFNTDYAADKDMILEGTTDHVGGIVAGAVTSADGFATLTLDEANGIEPGTEYENTNIGLIFKDTNGVQIPVRRTNLQTDSNNHFDVANIDNAFSDYGSNLTSIFTPMQFEISKVDVDKVQVIFNKITNGTYPELFYQVQYAPRIDDLYTQTDTWVKIPATTIPRDQMYGSEVVNVTITGTTNPEYYFRVVFFDSESEDPINSSLCLNLQLLGIDSGKPPLPREIQADAVYAGRKTVTVHAANGSDTGTVEIPRSDLRISFEKPLSWQLDTWTNIRNYAYGAAGFDYDYTFHVILSTYLPETVAAPETKDIGLNRSETVNVPVKQKRVYVFGRKDLLEDPADPNRLICTIPGDKLFWDNVAASSMINENNEDVDGNGVAHDYPDFLIPNTTYYMQIFTSRYTDNGAIYTDVWGDAAGLSAALKDKISYVSPVTSFTTWPLNEIPVPMPNINPVPKVTTNPATNAVTLGIDVNFQRIMTEVDWQRYTSVDPSTPRKIIYDVYISKNATDESSFVLAGTITKNYPADAEITDLTIPVTALGTAANAPPIQANTIYYLKAQASLVVTESGTDTLIGRSVFSPVTPITTPKVDDGGMDNIDRNPRAPSEFNIAKDKNGDPILSDAAVTFSWVHAESDVIYEMVCTLNTIDSAADPDDPTKGIAGDTDNAAFLGAYSGFVAAASSNTVTIDPGNQALQSLGFILNPNSKGITLPINRSLLRPNRLYFFSIRAVRNQGQANETMSRWITVPVTTKMVQAPSNLEAVRDLEIGFNVVCGQAGSTADSMEIYMKKSSEPDSSYVKLIRSQYSVVKDGTTYYFRVYNLEPNLSYSFRLYNKVGNTWYGNSGATWGASAGTPVTARTRDTLHEIEVRWEGQDPYGYYLEAMGEADTDYEALNYAATGFTDYGYDLPNGTRIKFYREKTNQFVEDNSPKFIYYAKIMGKPVRNANGSLDDKPLKTNTLYSVKLWARNLDDSLHVGPVSIRTDFSQEDYDNQKKDDNVIDAYNMQAEELTKKPYWLIDRTSSTALRVLIKSDMVSGLLQASPGGTVTVDLSVELDNPSSYDVLVPQKVLETIESNDSSLNIKLAGAEATLNRGSIDLAGLKRDVLANGAKEAMLRLRIERNGSVKKALPAGLKAISKDYVLSASAVGSRMAYSEINTMIYSILKDSAAKGPFKYGIFDRELTKVLQQIENYSYRSHSELNDMIDAIMNSIETEMSRYLKDIMDGGSGLTSDFAVNKPVASFPGRIGLKIEYQNESGLIAPYVNYSGSQGWKEASGAKGYVLQYVLFRAEGPGEFAVVVSGSVSVSPGGTNGNMILELGSKYDLSKVFGKSTIYPSNPVTGQQAVMLYAVVAERDDEMTGLTPAQKVSALGIGDIVGSKELTGYMDNQRSLSLSVKLYCEKSGIPVAQLKPAKTIIISNSSQINSRLYQYVVNGIDLGFAKTKNSQFDATGRSTAGQMLDMVSKVLEKLGEF